jgi:hypothetical protein
MKTLKNLIYLAIATVIACLCIHEARAQQRGYKANNKTNKLWNKVNQRLPYSRITQLMQFWNLNF